MGLVLDSSALIDAERAGKPISELLHQLEEEHGETDILISTISVVEIEHGLHRAKTPEQLQRRRDYLETIYAAIPLQPFTKEIGQLAAKIDAEAKMAGTTIPFSDLLIGTTALYFGYSISTGNERDFKKIPNLKIISL
jgi:tRNA(fMet)-specific endonuclease VapC